MKTLLHITLLYVLSISLVFAASRGMYVRIKDSDKPQAKVIGNVQLYADSHALIIGNDDYTAGWPKLSNAVKDAQLIAKVMRDKGFKTVVKLNLNAVQMEDALKTFFIERGENPEARLFLWFAGHGHTQNGEGYILPTDTPDPNVGAKFRRQAISMRRIGELVRLAESKHVYSVFDSCFSGTIFSMQRALPSRAITRATANPVRQFLSSGDANQTVSDDGTFREMFIRAVTGTEQADANRDGYLTATELGLHMTDRITNLTQQTPRYGKLQDKRFYQGGDFVFILPSAEAANIHITTPTKGTHADSREETFWVSINQSDPDQVRLFLQQFPQGLYAALARDKLNKLGATDTHYQVTLRSNVIGDTVYIDGTQQTGSTKMVVPLSAGQHQIKITKPGYHPYESSPHISGDQIIRAHLVAIATRAISTTPANPTPDNKPNLPRHNLALKTNTATQQTAVHNTVLMDIQEDFSEGYDADVSTELLIDTFTELGLQVVLPKTQWQPYLHAIVLGNRRSNTATKLQSHANYIIKGKVTVTSGPGLMGSNIKPRYANVRLALYSTKTGQLLFQSKSKGVIPHIDESQGGEQAIVEALKKINLRKLIKANIAAP